MSRRYVQQLPYSSDGDAQRSRLPNPTFATYSPRSNGSSARMSMGKSAMLCARSDPGSPAQTYGGDVVPNMSEQANGFVGPTYGRDSVQHWQGVSQVHFGGTAAAGSLWDASAPGPLGTYIPLGFDLRLDGGQSTQDLGIAAAHNFSFAGRPDQHSYIGATNAHPFTSQAVLHSPSDLAVDPFLAPAPFAHPSAFPHVVDAVNRAPNNAYMGLGDVNCTSIHDPYGRPSTVQSFNHVHPVPSHDSGLVRDIRSHAVDGQYDLYSSSNATSGPILSTNIASVDASEHRTADCGHANYPTAEDAELVTALINQLLLNEPARDTVSSDSASPQSVDIAQTPPPQSVPATPVAEDMTGGALCTLEATNLPGRLTVSTMPRRGAAFRRRKADGSIMCPVFCCDMTFTRLGHLRDHLLVHENKMRYHCTAAGCGKRYNTRGNLRSHVRHCHKD
ncbi:hypothetical protein GGF50DRAFT_125682 [Schizophyllum commune]